MVIKEQDCYVVVKKDGRRVKLHKFDGTYKVKVIVRELVHDGNSED